MSRLRYALRQLVLRPGLPGVVIGMLALGIGATTAIFSLFHQVLVEPLPVFEPERLVNLGAPGPHLGETSCSSAGSCEQIFSYPTFRDLETEQAVFTGIAAHRDFVANLSGDGQTLAGSGIMVSGDYFRLLGVTPAIGRLIEPRDEPRVDESGVVVLSHAYWQSRFGADPGVLGRRLTVNGQALTIVGVAREGFAGTIVGLKPEVFVPITLRWLMEPTRRRDENNRLSYWVYLFARLEPGMPLKQASAGINNLYRGILEAVELPPQRRVPDDVVEQFLERRITVEPGARGQSQLPSNAQEPLTLLLGITGLVLLIVCVNIANLLLARGLSRGGEMAVRVTIGATRRRLVSQLLLESGLLAVIGGVLSLPVAALTLRVIAAFVPEQLAQGLSMVLSPVALLFAGAASLSTLLLFGAVPAVQISRSDPGPAVKGQTRVLGGHGMARLRAGLATVQIAFSMLLLVLAGLFAKSLVNIARLDLGMEVDSLVTFTVSPRMNGHTPVSTMRVFDEIEERLAAEPGVTHVGSARIALLSGRSWGSLPAFEGFAGEAGVNNRSLTNEVSPGFFRTLSVPVLSGRAFTSADRLGAPRVAIVNESFVRQFELGAIPIGRRFDLGSRAQGIEIVGVVADTKYSGVRDEMPTQLFLPRLQDDNLDALSFYVRGDLDADLLMRTIPRVVSGVDAGLPVSNLRTMERQVRNDLYLDRLVTTLAAGFAGLATLLAAVGLYGVLAYNVAQRTRELGLRLALGATPRRLRVLVLRQVGLIACAGTAIGLAAAIGIGRLAEALLFGLSGYDPFVSIAAAASLATVVLAAGYLPARRASSVTPMEALRYE